MMIYVSKEDILRCTKRWNCPIETAISRAIGQQCIVNEFGLAVYGNGIVKGRLPVEAMERIQTFKAGQAIDEFKFELI